MQECPKCKQWTYDYNERYGELQCYRTECNHSERYCPTRWHIENSIFRDKQCYPSHLQLRCIDCPLLLDEHRSKLVRLLVAEGL